MLSLGFRLRIIQVDSVRRWMDDLKLMTECECMCILQSKPIGKEEDSQSDLLLSSQGTAPSSLEILLKRAWIVSTELTKIVEKLMKSRWRRLHSMAIRISCHVRSMLKEYHSFNRTSTEEMQKSLVAELEACDNIYSMEGAICSLYSLTQEGSRLCSLVAQEEAVVALFKICRQDCFRCLHSPALRSLASLCSVEEGLCQMEKVDGILCLTDMLTDETQPEATRAEVAAVIAQITSPQLPFTQHLSSFLENMEEIVTALLRLCKEASCGEVCLLASAALANITFFDTLACEMLLQMNAMKILLNVCTDKQRIDTSFARDQLASATLFQGSEPAAHMSVIKHFFIYQGVATLMEMLSEKSASGRLSEISSCERVQQKAAVTLARLCRDPEVARCAIKQNCIPRLIQLCRSPEQRHNSDAVLVACLAALRRLATMCPEGLEDSDFKQLVKPRLVDSFLLCSNMEESFV
ncbi:hypothetical protein XELAEV_18021715mg [Xenopus laevis]|uniref:INSC spindle orientation adaptor protein n=1 Tax=Xenopus laevis TaxID=8355 RepID=A0A974D0V8_XENLA|nr:hypothetical protein XELAEV_18021715mg [Xenopus laevis]